MKLRKVISGGQDGADYTALVEAHRLGLETGGTAPKGWRTETGPRPELGTKFGLVESPYWQYQPRTKQNVKDGQVTLWFGKQSPGYWCTRTACEKIGRLFHENPDADLIKRVAEQCEIVNFAGNRSTKNPDVVRQVQDAFVVIAEVMRAGTA